MMRSFPTVALLVILFFLCSSCGERSKALAQDPTAAEPLPGSNDPLVTWQTYGGDKKALRYAKLDQINRSSVDQLEVAWTYHTGDVRDDSRGTIEANPIIVDGVLYVTSPALKVVALDAATGEERWTFDPFKGETARGVNRGVAYWESEGGEDKRILFTAGWTPRLYALDAETGRPIESFGEGGVVDFTEGIEREGHGSVSATNPGIVYDDLLILGTRLVKGPKRPASPGDVAAYDVRTGERAWVFHTIPHPGEFGNDTWAGDAWKTEGGANVWGGMSLDEERGLVFLPVSTPGYSFYGGTRKGKNLFSNSVVALDAATGERIWHYQLVHHDIWDRDLGAPPILATVEHDGEKVDAVAQASKRGDLFLLDRETGEPLFPVEEKPVPASTLPGEEAWPTQPVPLKPPPFSRQGYGRDDLPTISEEARDYALKRLGQMEHGRRFLPPSTKGTILLPGLRGGAHWGGGAYDLTTGMLYINATEVPWELTMVPAGGAEQKAAASESASPLDSAKGKLGQTRTAEPEGANAPASRLEEKKERAAYPYIHTGYKKFLDPEGYPAIKPPWGTLNAIDLNKGEIAWQVPLGEFEELTERGIPPTGTDNLGGPIVTAGGLVFIGATKDEKFRAFDSKTGEVLWETTLPAGGYATPSTYAIDGKQYVVIAAGGAGLLGTKKGDAIVAFALP